ncbi:cytochrome b subunit of succinate dehydrogenase, Sdh3p [Malassezia cuniculi]|uniref:Cytochrome b subunit of succinate dehydrogenase, Sdh3p n=1 Tax=Malassezia cuniculi TaxID=948313 RepID=A0AAF0EQ74_9BASI|nr:cytochrome b subunit of succinate dehydrogenase, Sdh3p [Malassezia cuniculi]
MSVFAASRMVSALRVSPVTLGQQQLRLISSTAVAHKLPIPTRNAPTTTITPEQDLKHLNATRNERPIAPHLSIYQPQLTWYSSMFHRITGGTLGAGLYAFAIAYVAAPAAGFGDIFSSAALVDFVHQLPVWAKYAIKVPFATLFSYHFFNGFRHLSWDSGRFLDLKKSYAAGYTVIGLSALATVGLVML